MKCSSGMADGSSYRKSRAKPERSCRTSGISLKHKAISGCGWPRVGRVIDAPIVQAEAIAQKCSYVSCTIAIATQPPGGVPCFGQALLAAAALIGPAVVSASTTFTRASASQNGT